MIEPRLITEVFDAVNPIVQFAIARHGSQKKLANACGVTQDTVWKWLHSRTHVAPKHVFALSRATNGKFQPHEIRPDLPELFPQP